MGITYVIGGAAAKHADWMCQDMLAHAAAHPKQRIFYFVPEQATLQAQKDLTARHAGHCVMNIDILSFQRLAYRLTEELGNCLPVLLEDIGKQMVIRKLLTEKDAELKVYGGKAGKQGFTGEVRSMISELSQYMVNGERLEEAAAQTEDLLLAGKLHDLALLEKSFRAFLQDRYLTEEDLMTALCPLIERSKMLSGARIYLNGYTGFTPSQYALLESLLQKSEQMIFGIVMEPKYFRERLPENHLFSMSAQTIARLDEQAICHAMPMPGKVFLPEPEMEPSLKHLYQGIFRYPITRMEGETAIEIHSLARQEDEIDFLISRVQNLVQRKGYRYREIGVLCGDVAGYSELLQKRMYQAGIPCFIDYKEDALKNPMVDFLRSALAVVNTDFRTEEVVRYMKNRLSGYAYDEVCDLENYLIARGIRGFRSWERGFEKRYSTEHTIPLERLQKLAQQMTAEFSLFREELRQAEDGRGYLMSLYRFMTAHDLYAKMQAWTEELSADNRIPWNRRKEKEYGQIYEAVLTILDHMDQLLGDTPMKLPEFINILDAGLEETKIGVIPPEQDCILVGDVKRSRLAGIRTLIFIGVNEGVVPGIGHNTSLLNELERTLLQEQKIMLAEQAKDSIGTAEFYLYLALVKPSEQLILTFRRMGNDAKEMKPSYAIFRILRMFSGLSVCKDRENEDFFSFIGADGGIRAYQKGLTEGGALAGVWWSVLQRWFAGEEGRKLALERPELMQGFLQAFDQKPQKESGQLSEKVAAELYGRQLKGSVSRMECFAECPYRHFAQYGLRLEERAEPKASPVEIGNAMHETMKLFVERIGDITGTDAQARYQCMHEVFNEVIAKPEYEIFQLEPRGASLITKLEERLQQTVKALYVQLKEGTFVPHAVEKRFVFSGEHMELSGSIDRIDISENDTRSLIKVVDYKSSEKDLNLNDLYEGLDVQIALYLREAERLLGENSHGAAAFYSVIDDPVIEDSETPDIEILKALKPKGIFQDDHAVLRALDQHSVAADGSLQSDYASAVSPIDIAKSGDLKSTVQSMSEHALAMALDYAERKVNKQAADILAGSIKKKPYQKKKEDACKYCPYASVCMFDEKLGDHYRVIPERKRDEAIAAIREAMEAENGGNHGN